MSSQFGWSEKEIVVEQGSTITELKKSIEDDSDAVRFESFHANAAVNQEVAKDQTTLNDGDEVVFLPPLAGG